MPTTLNWIVMVLSWLIRRLLNPTPSAVTEAEKAGAAEARARQEAADAADVQNAVQAACAASRAAAADPGGLRAPADPDCRDCKA